MANSKAKRITGLVFKLIAGLIIISVNAVLFWRMCAINHTPDDIKALIVDQKLINEYQKNGEKTEMFFQYQDDFTTAERNYGYFSITEFVFIPATEQLQIVVRYNNSTLEAVKKDYGLSEAPPREAGIFDVTVVKTVDLTPDDKSDNDIGEGLSKERIKPTAHKFVTSGIYNYCRFLFDGVTTEDAEGIFVDFYYKDDVDYEKLSYGTLCVYSYNKTNVPCTMNSQTKRAIENILKK
ncbi:MAG: hypothetical protein MR471_00650 [Clostridia bacterium]|nr:hypothetical protein [Clostridia bacterium]MDY3785373.1 hypothetical protein [Eubacteriales bacterium]